MKKPLPYKAYKKGFPTDLVRADEFRFSLYNSDLVSIADENSIMLGYCKTFCKFNIAIFLDNFSGKTPNICISNRKVTKYQVTPLGYYHPIRQEKRLLTLAK